MTTITEAPAVKVGDIFAASWGYDETHYHFFQVVGLTPSGKSVRVVAIGREVVGGNGVYDELRPVPGSAKPDAKVLTKRLSPSRHFGASFTVNSYTTAFLVQDPTRTFTATGPYGGR